MFCINKPYVICFVNKLIRRLAHSLSFLRWRIHFRSYINLLFVLYPMRQSWFRDVAILCHRRTGTSPVDLLQNFVLFMNGSCFEFLFNESAIFWCWSVLGIFQCLDVYLFKFLGSKHSNVLLKQIYYAQGEWKTVPLNELSHWVLVKWSFFTCKGVTSSGDIKILSH